MGKNERFEAATDRLQKMLKRMKENGDIGQYILLCEDGDDFMHMVSITNASVCAVTRMLYGFSCNKGSKAVELAFVMAFNESEEFRRDFEFLLKNPDSMERLIKTALENKLP